MPRESNSELLVARKGWQGVLEGVARKVDEEMGTGGWVQCQSLRRKTNVTILS